MPMLFNPGAERFTFNQLRSMVIRVRLDLKNRLDEYLEQKALSEQVYLQCRKTDEDQRTFSEEIKLLDHKIERVDQTAYHHISHDLLAREQMYGFGTPLPITPQSPIEVIPPNYWLFLELNSDKSEAHGHGLHYVGVFFQQAQDVPEETIALVKQRQSNTSIAIPDADQSPTREAPAKPDYYTSPYIQLMLEAAEYFDIDESIPPYKDSVMEWVAEQARKRGINLSKSNIESMATFIRTPESQKGGNRIVLPKKDKTPA